MSLGHRPRSVKPAGTSAESAIQSGESIERALAMSCAFCAGVWTLRKPWGVATDLRFNAAPLALNTNARMHADAFCRNACLRKTRCDCPASNARGHRQTATCAVLKQGAATHLRRDGSLQVAVACGTTAKGLSQREIGATYNLTVDDDVYFIGASSQRARAQIVYILTAINPEV